MACSVRVPVCGETEFFFVYQVMPPKKAPPYLHKCAACGTDDFKKRPQARNLVVAPASERGRIYPHISSDNQKLCEACYKRLQPLYAVTVTPVAAIANHTQALVTTGKRRLTQGVAEAERRKDGNFQDMLDDRTPAGNTRRFDTLSPHSKRARAFSTVDASAVAVTDECVIVREHMLLLLISLVSCGRFTSKLASGDLALPAYVLTHRDVIAPTQLFSEATDGPSRQCPGELKLTSKKGLVVGRSSSL